MCHWEIGECKLGKKHFSYTCILSTSGSVDGPCLTIPCHREPFVNFYLCTNSVMPVQKTTLIFMILCTMTTFFLSSNSYNFSDYIYTLNILNLGHQMFLPRNAQIAKLTIGQAENVKER